MDGLNTVLPYGLRKIDALRTLTTESTAVLMPFSAQEINHKNGIYCGLNAISKNLIFVNRTELLNGNGFILGVSGAGKSFFAKKEIIPHVLRGESDVIIIDPEREYSPSFPGLAARSYISPQTPQRTSTRWIWFSDYADSKIQSC